MNCPFCETAAAEWAREGHGPAEGPASAEGRAPADGPDAGQRYFRCPACDLTFLDPARRPTAAAEEERYRLHTNGAGDAGYIRYIAGVAEAGLLPFIAPGEAVLDFGCGPFPALAEVLGPRGRRVESWDPHFAPDPAPLGRRWGAVACIEVAEHFREPAASFGLLASLLAPGGVLCIRTLPPPGSPADFLDWWYRRDPTHIAFYSARCLRAVRGRFGLDEIRADGKGLYTWRKSG